MAYNNKQIDGDLRLDRHMSVGGRLTIGKDATISGNVKIGGWLEAPNIKDVNKGFFSSLAKLQAAYPEPQDGWLAGVGIGTPFTAYMGEGGRWVPAGKHVSEGTINVVMNNAEIEERIGEHEQEMSTLEGRVDALETATVVKIAAAYTIKNTTNTLSASQCVKMPVGHHRIRLRGLPTVPKIRVFETEVPWGTSSQITSTSLYEKYNPADGIVIEYDSTQPYITFQTQSSETFTYQAEEVVDQVLQDVVDDVRATNGRIDVLDDQVVAECVTAAYTIKNTTNTLSASQCVKMPVGHHRIRLRGLPTVPKIRVFETEVPWDTSSQITSTSLYEKYNPADGIVIEYDSTQPYITFQTQSSETFTYQAEEVVDQVLQDVVDDVRATNGRVDALETATTVVTERVTAVYTVYNTNSTAAASQCLAMPVGHHRVRFRLGDLTVVPRLRVADTPMDWVEQQVPVTVLYDRSNARADAVIEFDTTQPYVMFMLGTNDKFSYQVEEIEPVSVQTLSDDNRRSLVDASALLMPWRGKVLAAWGDSVMAISNGDTEWPYGRGTWVEQSARAHGFKRLYCRSIGGQTIKWTSHGGSVAFVDSQGRYLSRDGNSNKDVYAGTLPSGAVSMVRTCGCSWDRMTGMFPEALRAEVDCVLVMYHNDAGSADTPLQWVEGSTTDPEWAASTEYAIYGGDYNITSVRGAMASAVMKLQTLLPNAQVVLCTPMSGRGAQGALNVTLRDDGMESLSAMVRDMGRILSVPVIDMYATCGINGLNRTAYITDSVHPYGVDGQRMIARALTAGLKTVR